MPCRSLRISFICAAKERDVGIMLDYLSQQLGIGDTRSKHVGRVALPGGNCVLRELRLRENAIFEVHGIRKYCHSTYWSNDKSSHGQMLADFGFSYLRTYSMSERSKDEKFNANPACLRSIALLESPTSRLRELDVYSTIQFAKATRQLPAAL